MYGECIYCGRRGLQPPFHVKVLGNTEINFDLHSIRIDFSGTKVEVVMKRKEYLVFEYLARHLRELVAPEMLREYLKVENFTTLYTHVSIVRMKLDSLASSCSIRNSRRSQKELGSLGYMMEVRDE